MITSSLGINVANLFPILSPFISGEEVLKILVKTILAIVAQLKQQKSKSQHIDSGDVLISNITFLIFLFF